MTDIELVIKIDEEKYSYVKNQVKNGIDNPLKVIIANGTPLPKGHGDLIDRRELKEDVGYTGYNCDFQNCLDDAPTIIEADKAESEEV